MRLRIATLIPALLFIWALPVRADVDYVRQVKPIFLAHCTACHGALKQKSGLRLDAGQLILKGDKSGAIVRPKSADKSRLMDALTGANGVTRMPKEGEPLKAAEVAIIKQWIDEGAKAPDETVPAGPDSHWSFKPPVRPAVPIVKNSDWVRNPIDAFIAAEHEKHGLKPRPQAGKEVLLRRITLDLTGLPPTRDELRAFLSDHSSDAYEKVVDRLLASPRYGERWGRHWMDVWRYSDWAGYGPEVRYSQPHIWRWRDWIVESLNADKPYDQMVREMLAGDEIAPTDPQTLRATGFLVRSWFKFNRNTWMEEVVEHTGKAFLGLTLNCAKCHDHMFDPVSQREYFGFRAVFETYGIRTDTVASTLDTKVDGLPRVCDTDENAKTYLFIRGDERNPKTDEPIAPVVPAILGGTYKIEKVTLPPTAYYRGLNPDVRKLTVAAADDSIKAADGEIAKSQTALAVAQGAYKALAAAPAPAPKQAGMPAAATTQPQPAPPDPAKQASEVIASATALRVAGESVEIAKLKLNVARAEKVALEARIAADDAKYASPMKPEAKDLVFAAGRAERFAKLCSAELNAQVAHNAMIAAQLAVKGTDAKALKALADAGLKLIDQKTALEGQRAILDKPNEFYTPITQVYPATSTGRRLALAKWITRRDHPTAARVAVNQVWMRHFGTPIVSTVFDFGLNGKRPTHPELLDWLSVQLMDSSTGSGQAGWSMKKLHRLIVTSAAYRMRSDFDSSNDSDRKADPDNVYLWHANTRRMEAEIVRDSVLFVGGQLDLTQGGPDIDHEKGLTIPRRSIYFRHAHEKEMTFLKLFDAASPNECYRRNQSVMPQQALAMANSPLALAQSRRIASQITRESGGSIEPVKRFITDAFEQVLGRQPSGEELNTCETFLAEQGQRLRNSKSLTLFASGDASAVPASWDPAQRARENLILVLINHNDFVTIR